MATGTASGKLVEVTQELDELMRILGLE